MRSSSNRCTGFDTRYSYAKDLMNGLSIEELQDKLKKIDPTDGKCLYVEWIYKQYYNRHFRLEDLNSVGEDLRLYDTNKNRFQGTSKDINTFTYSSLKVFLRDMFEVTLVEDTTPIKDVKVLYDGPLGKLSIPLTMESSCKLGKGTKWCTAAETSDNRFNSYNKQGPLYVWVDNNWNKDVLKELGNKSKKFQFHFQSGQYMDELDNTISADILYYFMMEHPVIKKLFRKYEESLTTPKEIAKYVRDMDPDDELGQITRLVVGNDDVQMAYINLDKEESESIRESCSRMCYTLLDDLLGRIDENTGVRIFSSLYDINGAYEHKTVIALIDKYVVPDINKAYQFAILRKERWEIFGRPEIDIAILSDPKYTMDYILGIPNLAHKTTVKTENIIVKALVNREKSISIMDLYNQDKRAAAYYAIYVLRTRIKWIENGSFGSEELDQTYYKLFTKSDRPDNIYKLDKEHVKYVRLGEEDKFLQGLSVTMIPKWQHGNMFEFYREYVRLNSRSDVIEKYLVNTYLITAPHSLVEELFVLLSLLVFKARLCYSLSHINPNIELEVFAHGETVQLEWYRSIFIDVNLNSTDMGSILMFMRINGQTEAGMKQLVKLMLNDKTTDLKLEDFDFLTYENAKYLYENAKNYSAKVIGYTLMHSGTGSRELEQEFRKEVYNSSSIVAYQFYWKKFLNYRQMKEFEKNGNIYKTYLNSYLGTVDSIEQLYLPNIEYLRYKVGF